MAWLSMLVLCSFAGATTPVGPGEAYETLAEALADASSGDVLGLVPQVWTESGLQVQVDVTILAQGSTFDMLVALGGAPQIFEVQPGARLELVGGELEGGGNVRLVYVNAGEVVLDSVTTRNTYGDGGAVMADASTVTVRDSWFGASVAPTHGGHLELRDSTGLVERSWFEGGVAVDGGAIYATTDLTVRDTHFVGNVATDSGGGIYASAGHLVLERAVFLGNDGLVYGGAFRMLAGEGDVVDSVFIGNTTPNGNLKASASRMSLTGSWFEGNDAATGVTTYWSSVPDVTVSNNGFCANTGGERVFKLTSCSGVLVENNLFIANDVSSYEMTSIYATIADLRANTFVGNHAASTGAAFTVTSSGDLHATGNLIVDNVADGGAVVQVASGVLTESDNLFWNNTQSNASVPLDPSDRIDTDPGIGFVDCEPSSYVPAPGSVAAGYGAFSGATPSTVERARDADGDGFWTPVDCDDGDGDVTPLSVEIPCDGRDNDCDPLTVDAQDYDGDGVDCLSDCSEDPERAPGLPEICDGIDNDCDGGIDEDVTTTWWLDGDGDGYGDAAAPVEGCDPPAGAVGNADDCDDRDASVGLGSTWWVDLDRDGHGDPGVPVVACSLPLDAADIGDDCDDGDPSVHPGATEARDDGIDQDCSGEDLQTTLDGAAGIECGCRSTSGASPSGWLALGVLAARR